MSVHHTAARCFGTGVSALMLAVLLLPTALRAGEASGEEAGEDGEARPRIKYWLRDPGADVVQPPVAQPASQPGDAIELPSIDPDAEPAPLPPEPRPAVVNPDKVKPPKKEKLEQKAEETFTPEQLAVFKRQMAMRRYFNQKLEEAKLSYKAKDFRSTIRICRNILSADPRYKPAIELLNEAHKQNFKVDQMVTESASQRKDLDALLESEQHSVRPPAKLPEKRPQYKRRGDDPATARRKTMDELLNQRLTVDFMKADLEWVLNTLFILTGVNIIADPASLEDKSLTLHVEDLPLRSVLDFIVRNNDGIQYSVTEDAIWITATSADDLKKLMYPKVYPIHHGLTSAQEAQGSSRGRTGRGGTTGLGGGGGGGGGGAAGGGGGEGGGGAGSGGSYLELVLAWLQEQADPQTFPDGSQWFIDRQTTQLVVFTTPAGHAKIQDFLDHFDQPAIQVLIKARFLEVSIEDNKALGLDIQSLNTRVGAPSTETPGETLRNPFKQFAFLGGTPANIPGTLGTGSVLTFTGSRTNPQFQLQLNALLNDRRTKILSEPQILAINHKEAYIDITTHFSFIDSFDVQEQDLFSADGVPIRRSFLVPEFDDEEIGFTLHVTPSVGRDMKTINLHLRPVIDSLAQGQNIQQFQQFEISTADEGGNPVQPPIQRPTIDQTELETDVVLEDNGYVIIGGLIRNRYEKLERKIPGLHRIPGLGRFFKSVSEQKLTSNLVIIVEAQIISPRGRTYKTLPEPDAADIRAGGTPHAPGQTSEFEHPDHVKKALGIAPQARGETSLPPAGANLPAAAETRGDWSVGEEENAQPGEEIAPRGKDGESPEKLELKPIKAPSKAGEKKYE